VTCTDINECTSGANNCSANATCTNTLGSFTCACNTGYSGTGVVCSDINECTTGANNCSANATCTNTLGSFTCACNTGYTGDGVTCVGSCGGGTVLVGNWNGFEYLTVPVVGAMTDTNVFNACDQCGYSVPCAGQSGCTFNDSLCLQTNNENDCYNPMQDLSQLLCGVNPNACPSLWGTYQYMGQNWNAASSCGAESSNWCATGNSQFNKQALCVRPFVGGTTTFNYTGGAQTWTVPAGVTSIDVVARGAKGGCNLGGLGGESTATIPVTPGETLNLYVGGQGGCSLMGNIPGGFNGGGAKSTASGDFWEGGSGGGGSDIRRGGTALVNRVIVAAGGGGRGYGGQAGGGGGLSGQDGDPTGGGCNTTCAGKGGSQMSGGIGGFCFSGCQGADGSLGRGGDAQGCAASGGGGGGGYYGGGGGAHCSAGGGSSRADFTGNTSPATTPNLQNGDGYISITW